MGMRLSPVGDNLSFELPIAACLHPMEKNNGWSSDGSIRSPVIRERSGSRPLIFMVFRRVRCRRNASRH